MSYLKTVFWCIHMNFKSVPVWEFLFKLQLHSQDLNDGYDWGRLNLRSVTEQSNLEDFLSTAELAGTEFIAGNIYFLHKGFDMIRFTAFMQIGRTMGQLYWYPMPFKTVAYYLKLQVTFLTWCDVCGTVKYFDFSTFREDEHSDFAFTKPQWSIRRWWTQQDYTGTKRTSVSFAYPTTVSWSFHLAWS